MDTVLDIWFLCESPGQLISNKDIPENQQNRPCYLLFILLSLLAVLIYYIFLISWLIRDGGVGREKMVKCGSICIPPAGQNYERVPPIGSKSVLFSETIKGEEGNQDECKEEKADWTLLTSARPSAPSTPGSLHFVPIGWFFLPQQCVSNFLDKNRSRAWGEHFDGD